jgi:hypothetical protein
MDWQALVSLLIVAAAAGLLLRGRFHRRKFSWQRDTACGCSGVATGSPQSSIVYRARKGRRPEVLIKMK